MCAVPAQPAAQAIHHNATRACAVLTQPRAEAAGEATVASRPCVRPCVKPRILSRPRRRSLASGDGMCAAAEESRA